MRWVCWLIWFSWYVCLVVSCDCGCRVVGCWLVLGRVASGILINSVG